MNISARYLCQGKAEEGGDAVASLTDDNAALAQRVGAEFIEISATQYYRTVLFIFRLTIISTIHKN